MWDICASGNAERVCESVSVVNMCVTCRTFEYMCNCISALITCVLTNVHRYISMCECLYV